MGKKNWRSGTKIKIRIDKKMAWLYACPDCFKRVKEDDSYCSVCGFYLKGKCVNSYKELKERLK